MNQKSNYKLISYAASFRQLRFVKFANKNKFCQRMAPQGGALFYISLHVYKVQNTFQALLPIIKIKSFHKWFITGCSVLHTRLMKGKITEMIF